MYTLTGLEEGTDYSITITAALTGGRTENHSINGTTLTASKYYDPCMLHTRYRRWVGSAVGGIDVR